MGTDEIVEKAARRMAVADGQNPDKLSHNSFEWWRHYVPMARAALEAALSAAEPVKPVSEEYQHPNWIWYCESTTGPVVTLGRWAKTPNQRRYKLADIQPTEHDHPAPSVAVKLDSIAHRVHALARMVGTSFFEDVEKDLRDLSSALSAQVQDVAGLDEKAEAYAVSISETDRYEVDVKEAFIAGYKSAFHPELQDVATITRLADRLAGLKFNSCTCDGLRMPGCHEEGCATDIISDACRLLRSAAAAPANQDG